MGTNEVSSFNQRVHQNQRVLQKGTYRHCLFAESCSEEVIEAHSVSRSVLEGLQDDHHVMQFGIRFVVDESGRSCPHFEPTRHGIRQASVGTFVCWSHDRAFATIDTIPMDFTDPRVCNLLFYRAVLKEIWLLLRTRDARMLIEQEDRFPMSLPDQPRTRLRALQELRHRMEPFLMAENHTDSAFPVAHMIRHVKSDHPIMAASYASGGSNLVVHNRTDLELPASAWTARTGEDPNACWGFTVIPQDREHTVLASWVKGSSAENYFRFLNEVDGKELQAAVSAELICFCENWFLHPKVCASYSGTRQKAILSAYDNVPDLLSSSFHWRNTGDQVKWFDHMKIPNRHQINLFRYDRSIFA